mmetsp:Transcript_2744/g.8035  ORF Transcript_2744/g.8035 Transcript_2744/m.8035 type:complete len:231 (-) Transcript_2744:448-1140(-)
MGSGQLRGMRRGVSGAAQRNARKGVRRRRVHDTVVAVDRRQHAPPPQVHHEQGDRFCEGIEGVRAGTEARVPAEDRVGEDDVVRTHRVERVLEAVEEEGAVRQFPGRGEGARRRERGFVDVDADDHGLREQVRYAHHLLAGGASEHEDLPQRPALATKSADALVDERIAVHLRGVADLVVTRDVACGGAVPARRDPAGDRPLRPSAPPTRRDGEESVQTHGDTDVGSAER